jgi:hypothetical protein
MAEYNRYEGIAERALVDPAYREGLEAAATVCRAQSDHGHPDTPPCPSDVAAHYLEQLASGVPL